MGTYILTSMFSNGFQNKVAELFQRKILQRNKFAFIASEFEKLPQKTDKYFHIFLNMFQDIGIHFQEACVIDGRMTPEDARETIRTADVLWLSGGDTPTQFGYFQKYGLDKIIRQHQGVVIGMSAGSINMAETAICTSSCGHHKQQIYKGLGCVRISVEPHFIRSKVSDELLELSKEYAIYGLCDESVIVCEKGKLEFYGEIYKISNATIKQIENENI